MIDGKNNDPQGLERVASFMFQHGLLTLADGSPLRGSSDDVCIPNQMVRGYYLVELHRILQLAPLQVQNVIENPTVDSLHDLIWSIVDKQETLHDLNISESALQAYIESALRATAAATQPPAFSVAAEKKVGYGFSDLELQTGDNLLIIEFKRVRWEWLEGINLKVDRDHRSLLTEFSKDARNHMLRKYELLRTQKIKDKQRMGKDTSGNDAKGGTVGELEARATLQLQEYMKGCVDEGRFDQVRGFVVIQVGLALLVSEVVLP
jgi:hypothetical protein